MKKEIKMNFLSGLIGLLLLGAGVGLSILFDAPKSDRLELYFVGENVGSFIWEGQLVSLRHPHTKEVHIVVTDSLNGGEDYPIGVAMQDIAPFEKGLILYQGYFKWGYTLQPEEIGTRIYSHPGKPGDIALSGTYQVGVIIDTGGTFFWTGVLLTEKNLRMK